MNACKLLDVMVFRVGGNQKWKQKLYISIVPYIKFKGPTDVVREKKREGGGLVYLLFIQT